MKKVLEMFIQEMDYVKSENQYNQVKNLYCQFSQWYKKRFAKEINYPLGNFTEALLGLGYKVIKGYDDSIYVCMQGRWPKSEDFAIVNFDDLGMNELPEELFNSKSDNTSFPPSKESVASLDKDFLLYFKAWIKEMIDPDMMDIVNGRTHFNGTEDDLTKVYYALTTFWKPDESREMYQKMKKNYSNKKLVSVPKYSDDLFERMLKDKRDKGMDELSAISDQFLEAVKRLNGITGNLHIVQRESIVNNISSSSKGFPEKETNTHNQILSIMNAWDPLGYNAYINDLIGKITNVDSMVMRIPQEYARFCVDIISMSRDGKISNNSLQDYLKFHFEGGAHWSDSILKAADEIFKIFDNQQS